MATSEREALERALHDVLVREGIADQRGFVSEALAKAALRVAAPVSSGPAGGGVREQWQLWRGYGQDYFVDVAREHAVAAVHAGRRVRRRIAPTDWQEITATTLAEEKPAAASPAPAGDSRAELRRESAEMLGMPQALGGAAVEPGQSPVEPAPADGDGLAATLAGALDQAADELERLADQEWCSGEDRTSILEQRTGLRSLAEEVRARPTLSELLTSKPAVEEMAFQLARRELWSHYKDALNREGRQRLRWAQLDEKVRESWRRPARDDLRAVAARLSPDTDAPFRTTREQRQEAIAEASRLVREGVIRRAGEGG